MLRIPRSFPSSVRAVAAAAALAAFAALAAPAAADATPPPAWLLVKAGTLIDGSGRAPRKDVDILVKDGRIEQVGAHLSAPAGATTLDFSGLTVLPGLIDCHTHLTFEVTANSQLKGVTDTPADQALAASVYARRTLEAGFTTVRNVGAGEFVDVALQHAIDRGIVPGPRMIVSTNSFSTIGGHGDANGYRPGILEDHLDYTQGLPTGPDECRKAVRYAHKHGAAGIKAAVRAGVTSIEHGTYLDDEGIRLMKEKGCWLVPTRCAGEWVYDQADKGGIPPHAVAKAKQVGRSCVTRSAAPTRPA